MHFARHENPSVPPQMTLPEKLLSDGQATWRRYLEDQVMLSLTSHPVPSSRSNLGQLTKLERQMPLG